MIRDTQFEQDLRAIATKYGIDITLPYDRLVEAVEEAGQCGAWEIVQHCLYGIDLSENCQKLAMAGFERCVSSCYS